MADDTDKTEEATPERRRKAREEGNFPRAKDAGNTAATIAVLATIAGTSTDIIRVVQEFTVRCYREPYWLMQGDPYALLYNMMAVLFAISLPTILAANVASLAVGFYEAGFQPNMALAEPKFSRVDPSSRLKSMFDPQQTLVNVAMQVARVTAVAAVAYWCVKKSFPILVRLSTASLVGAVNEAVKAIADVTMWTSLALVTLVTIDFFYQKYKHEKSMMMSLQEVKDEMKQHEGDPKVKAKIRARAREILKRGLKKAIATADFVVANPTHVSVAIRYRPNEGAPIVVAKGYDEVAVHIRHLAKEGGVPIITNVMLARSLAKRVKVGRSIPVDLYSAVAEVLAFVYRLKNRKPAIVS